MKVVVIGAGIAGLAIGWRLAQAGVEVTVLERAQAASGATWAAAGMIGLIAEQMDAQPAEIKFSLYANGLWPDFAKQVEAESGRNIAYSRSGALMLARDQNVLAALEARLGPVLEILDAARVHAISPMLTGDIAGALWAPEEAHVDNRALGPALAIAFQRAGGTLAVNEAVVRIERRGGRAAVAHTPFGHHHADAFVLAAGAWSGLVEEALAPVTPVKGEMIAFEAKPGAAPAHVFHGPVVRADDLYIVPRGARLLVGATVETAGFDTQPTAKARDYLRRGAEALMPGLVDWVLAEHWAGLRPRAPDGMLMLGPTAVEGLWVAAGQYRNGILFAPAVAEAMHDMLLGGAPPVPAFDPRRFVS